MAERRTPIQYIRAAYQQPDEVSFLPVAIGIAAVVLVGGLLFGQPVVGVVVAVGYTAVTAIQQRWNRRRRR